MRAAPGAGFGGVSLRCRTGDRTATLAKVPARGEKCARHLGNQDKRFAMAFDHGACPGRQRAGGRPDFSWNLFHAWGAVPPRDQGTVTCERFGRHPSSLSMEKRSGCPVFLRACAVSCTLRLARMRAARCSAKSRASFQALDAKRREARRRRCPPGVAGCGAAAVTWSVVQSGAWVQQGSRAESGRRGRNLEKALGAAFLTDQVPSPSAKLAPAVPRSAWAVVAVVCDPRRSALWRLAARHGRWRHRCGYTDRFPARRWRRLAFAHRCSPAPLTHTRAGQPRLWLRGTTRLMEAVFSRSFSLGEYCAAASRKKLCKPGRLPAMIEWPFGGSSAIGDALGQRQGFGPAPSTPERWLEGSGTAKTEGGQIVGRGMHALLRHVIRSLCVGQPGDEQGVQRTVGRCFSPPRQAKVARACLRPCPWPCP
ncbi:hypothetical protein FQR65_LT19986 [Abscondita terminalis]|nr:hypothetical protein FQR65_LT19986 [Abscondita terminalis]